MNAKPLSFLLLAATSALSDDAFVRITGDRVNLRSAPRLESEVVAQAMAGDVLALHGDPADPWVAVAVPTNAPVWIYVPLIEDSTVSVRKAWVRAGASVNYQPLGLLEQGDRVEVLEISGDWARIVPPPSASVYVTNAYVASLSSPAPVEPKIVETDTSVPPSAEPKIEEPGTAVSAPAEPKIEEPDTVVSAPAEPKIEELGTAVSAPAEPKIEEPDTAVLVPAEPKIEEPDTDIQPSEPVEKAEVEDDSTDTETEETPAETAKPGTVDNDRPVPVGPANIPSDRLRLNRMQANPGTFTGRLQAAVGAGPHPTRWQLVATDGEDAGHPVCYVYGNTRQLASLSGERLTVSGAVYWFLETELPTLFAQDIGRHVSR